MTVQVRIPSALRAYAGGERVVHVEASTVGEAIGALVRSHQAVASHILDADGRVRGFVGLYVNSQDVRGLQGEATPVRAGDVVVILPSVAGGGR